MKIDKKNITILCKVVDNFGDIGFVYRLSRALLELEKSLRLRLIVSDLRAFSSLAPQVNSALNHQKIGSVEVFDWSADSEIEKSFLAEPPSVILECFQCGRPDSLEKILFEADSASAKVDSALAAADSALATADSALATVDDRASVKADRASVTVDAASVKVDSASVKVDCALAAVDDSASVKVDSSSAGKSALTRNSRAVQIINIDYLTAEDYADDFHKLKSGTRSISVKKTNFMPGFTNKTGGLILDRAFMNSLFSVGSVPSARQSSSQRRNVFSVVIFTYERDLSRVFAALSAFESFMRARVSGFRVRVFAASGQGFHSAQAAHRLFPAISFTALPFLPQEKWDALLCKADFLFARGEDSLSRACLSGIPFVWHAYKQTENYQLVKTAALLSRLKPFFAPQDFSVLSRYWQDFNTNDQKDNAEDLLQLLKASVPQSDFRSSFKRFSKSLLANGNLAARLLDFLDTLND